MCILSVHGYVLYIHVALVLLLSSEMIVTDQGQLLITLDISLDPRCSYQCSELSIFRRD